MKNRKIVLFQNVETSLNIIKGSMLSKNVNYMFLNKRVEKRKRKKSGKQV